jgi:hypothetical protein
MVPAIDADYGVYVKGKDGDWHFNMELFAEYLARARITWPLTEKQLKRSLCGQNSAGSRKSMRPFQGIICDDISEIAVGTLARRRKVHGPCSSVCSRSRNAGRAYSGTSLITSSAMPADALLGGARGLAPCFCRMLSFDDAGRRVKVSL